MFSFEKSSTNRKRVRDDPFTLGLAVVGCNASNVKSLNELESGTPNSKMKRGFQNLGISICSIISNHLSHLVHSNSLTKLHEYLPCTLDIL